MHELFFFAGIAFGLALSVILFFRAMGHIMLEGEDSPEPCQNIIEPPHVVSGCTSD